MQPVELPSLTSAPPKPAELLQRVPLQHVDGHVGVVADIEAGLFGVGREVHRYRRSRQAVCAYRHELFLHEAALARVAGRVAALLAKSRIAAIEHLHAVVAAIADIEQAVFGDLHAVYRRAEKRRSHVALVEIVHPDPRRGRGFVIDRVVAVGAEMPDVLPCRGIDDDDAAIAVAVRHVHAVGHRIDGDVRRQIEQRRSVLAAVLVIAVGPFGAVTADHHHELSVLGEFQDHAVGAVVRRPGRTVRIRVAAVPAKIDEAVVVDEDAVLAGRPDAAVFHPALPGIGRTAPRAQQLARRIELHDRRRGHAAVAENAVRPRESHHVDGLSVLVLVRRIGQRRFVVGQRARPLIDPDVIIGRHIEAAHLSDDPVIRQLLRPARVGDEARRLRRGRNAVDAGALGEPVQNAGRGERCAIGFRCLCLARRRDTGADDGSNNSKQFRSHFIALTKRRLHVVRRQSESADLILCVADRSRPKRALSRSHNRPACPPLSSRR